MKKLSRVVYGSLAALVMCVAMCEAGPGVAVAFAGDQNLKRAARAVREGEFETAEKLYRQLVEQDPQDVRARLGLSFALLKQRNVRDAYDQASRVLAIDPTSARAHALLGSALLAAGDFNLSVEEFRTALAYKSDEALAIAGLSMINFYENRSAIALEGLRRAVYLDPKEPDYIFYFAQAAARSERYREAADAYEEFLRVAPRTDLDRLARIRGLISFLRYLGAQRQLYQTQGAARTTVPFELVNSRPIIKVNLNNSKTPLRFVVDTGSGMCVLSTEAAERLNIKPVARGGQARAVGGGGRFEIIYGFLSSLRIGEASIENVPVYLRQFHNQQERVDGYIGLSVLSKYIASIDYGARQMTMLHTSERSAAASSAINFALPTATAAAAADTTAIALPNAARSYELQIRSTTSGFWSSAVVLEGIERPLNFIVDTGASISVISVQLTQTEDMSRFEQKRRLKIFGAAGVSEDVITLLLPHITLGDYRHPNLSAAVLDMSAINETSGFEQTGIIGGNILRYFCVTFDFQRGLVRLDPLPSAPAASPAPAPDANVTPASGAAL
ncbi:MAG: aspartyl protease family protein [Pyrinomonadaceae bacterium]